MKTKQISMMIRWCLPLIFFSFLICGCTSKTEEHSKLKVGVITVGPVNDAGFNQSNEIGRLYLQTHLNSKVETQIVENIAESADVERIMEKMIQTGTKLIFATSYGYLDSALKIAAKYPDVTFMHCAGNKKTPNLSTYLAYADEPQYLVGMAAAMLTKNNKLGQVAAHPIPNILREINAFTLGAQSVNPDILVHVVWTNSWYDPAVEAEAANSLADAGCDVIAAHLDSPISVVQTAEKRGVYSVGCHADCSKYAPQGWITGHEWVWGKIMVETAQAVIDNTWTNKMIRGGLKEGYVKLAKFGQSVTEKMQLLINKKEKEIVSNQFVIFTGPLYDQKGNLKLAENQTGDKNFIETMDWFVKGVIGSLPKK